MNWANRLTVLRIILVPVFITAILYYKLNLALVIFLIAALTDALDGYIARTFNQKTLIGTVMDPMADKALIISAYICFSIVPDLPVYLRMPIYVPMVIISRDLMILAGALIIYLVAGELRVRPSVLGKITTFFQMTTVLALLAQFIYSKWLWNITVVFTVLSGLGYMREAARQMNGHGHNVKHPNNINSRTP